MPGIFRRLVSLADQSLSLMRFNLWRRRSFEPASRAIARGTIFMVALLILLGYTVYTISRGLNVSTMYGRRSFRRTGFAGITPQPHLFTNHCTSAMLPGGDQNAFARLISVGQLCDDGTAWGTGIQEIANCTPVWYSLKGWDRNVNLFKDFYGENGGATEGTIATSTCLAFECPSCQDKSNHLYWYATYISLSFPPIANADGTSVWNPAAAKLGHIGSTAIWPWNNVSNPNNGRDPRTGERQCMPADIVNTPFLARNGTYNIATIAYAESSLSVSGKFNDFIGVPNQYTTTATYGTGKFGPSRQASYTLPADASLILRRDPWNEWDATQDYTASTLPEVIGSIGGLWSAFGGVLAGIFGTSMTFIVLGSKPIGITPLIRMGNKKASRRLDDLYLQPGRPIDAEARLRAVTAYMADLLVDTGELDLTLGRTPGDKAMDYPERNGSDSEVQEELLPLKSSPEDR